MLILITWKGYISEAVWICSPDMVALPLRVTVMQCNKSLRNQWHVFCRNELNQLIKKEKSLGLLCLPLVIKSYVQNLFIYLFAQWYICTGRFCKLLLIDDSVTWILHKYIMLNTSETAETLWWAKREYEAKLEWGR